jgi:hypothetical protein
MAGRLCVLFPLILTFSPGEKEREAELALGAMAVCISPAGRSMSCASPGVRAWHNATPNRRGRDLPSRRRCGR